jgi:transcription elongation factor GreA
MNQKTLLTQEGFQRLSLELEDLKARKEHLISQIEEVAQPDESSEDGLATQLKEELEVVNEKIDNIEDSLVSAEIITENKGKNKSTIVQVGTLVKIKISGNSIKEFNIVSHMESDPTKNKISDQSPLGQALIGKKVNDEIEVDAPVGKISYKIISIA